jgi:hypothetical protein
MGGFGKYSAACCADLLLAVAIGAAHAWLILLGEIDRVQTSLTRRETFRARGESFKSPSVGKDATLF